MIGSFRLPISLTSSGDTTAPTITSATVENVNPNKLVVVFSEVVTITNTTGLTITGAATPTLSAPTGNGSNTITFTLSAALTNGQSVTLNVASSNTIKDPANNSLAAATKTITNNVAAVGYEAETTSYINRVSTDTGVVINEAYIDTVYIQLKADASLASLLFWMDSKGGIKKDASNFISKTYDLSNSLNDTTQLTGASQPVLNTDITFDGSNDSLENSLITFGIGQTLYIKAINLAYGDILWSNKADFNFYLQILNSTTILLRSAGGGEQANWTVPAMSTGSVLDIFIIRTSSVGYTLYLNGVSYGEQANSIAGKFNVIGNYVHGSTNAFDGGIRRFAFFDEILTTTKMNNIKAL